MKTILILGAGKSTPYLVDYLAQASAEKGYKLILADQNIDTVHERLQNYPQAVGVELDMEEEASRRDLVDQADVVVSMLPAFMHPIVAGDCLELGKHFFSASYESDQMRTMRGDIERKGLFFLNECGLDPGIDHMSAMKIIHGAARRSEEILSFKSYCGGLLAPESEDNPWGYKFTWNPRNVVLAGQGTSSYIENGGVKFVPYHQLFRRVEQLRIPGLGDFEGYPNRDSLTYRKVYGLNDVPTMLRGTLRRTGFCRAWDVFVQLGMTDNSVRIELPEGSTLKQFLEVFLPDHLGWSTEEKLSELIPTMDFPTFEKIQWLGFFENRRLPKTKGTPAELLQAILEIDWALELEDRDMIVMKHLFEIRSSEGLRKVSSSLVCFGEDATYTAMAKTVGLPLAIAVDLFLEGKINLTGLHIPVVPELYLPILEKLEAWGIRFQEGVY
jgi:saccharopine dehydrogenase-like NADP-dependent oxidoreductase